MALILFRRACGGCPDRSLGHGLRAGSEGVEKRYHFVRRRERLLCELLPICLLHLQLAAT